MRVDPTQAVASVIERLIADHGEIGVQVSAFLDGREVVDAVGGLADVTSKRLVDHDTLFCAFSVTKAVTAVALHIQADRGLIEYDRPIAYYWPEFGVKGKEKGTVADALSHRLGVPVMPANVTPELICDWHWMTDQIARMRPLFEPGSRRAWHSYTFGWIVGEIVRRTDPKRRPFGQFVQDEICKPLGITDLWLGIPDGIEPRIAKMKNMTPLFPHEISEPGLISLATIPPAVAFTAEVYERADVRRACIPAAGGIMTARSCARFFAMLSCGGTLDGVRILSNERVGILSVAGEPDAFDHVLGPVGKLSVGGFQLAEPIGDGPLVGNMVTVGTNPRTFFHPGSGGQIGWADPDAKLAVAILRNRLIRPTGLTASTNPLVAIGGAIRSALDLH